MIEHPFAIFPIHLIFAKSARKIEILEQFNRGLKKLKQDGRYQKIIDLELNRYQKISGLEKEIPQLNSRKMKLLIDFPYMRFKIIIRSICHHQVHALVKFSQTCHQLEWLAILC